jgi:hypothetical protein
MARPCRWKHPVVAAQQVSRRRARPRCRRTRVGVKRLRRVCGSSSSCSATIARSVLLARRDRAEVFLHPLRPSMHALVSTSKVSSSSSTARYTRGIEGTSDCRAFHAGRALCIGYPRKRRSLRRQTAPVESHRSDGTRVDRDTNPSSKGVRVRLYDHAPSANCYKARFWRRREA